MQTAQRPLFDRYGSVVLHEGKIRDLLPKQTVAPSLDEISARIVESLGHHQFHVWDFQFASHPSAILS